MAKMPKYAIKMFNVSFVYQFLWLYLCSVLSENVSKFRCSL